MKAAIRCYRQGFTLMEMLLSMFIGGVLLGSVFMWSRAVISTTPSGIWSYTSNYGAHNYYELPSAGEFKKAGVLMAQLQEMIDTSSATFVIGGYRSIPGVSETGGQRAPIKAGSLFTQLTTLNTAANLATVQSSYDLDLSYITPELGASYRETTYDACDFTVITITGLNQVSSITQTRRYTATVAGENLVFYEVVLDANLSAARNSTDGAAGQNRWAYRYALRAVEDTWTMPAGALHYWFRNDTSWQRREEGPTRLIFPDPYLYAGEQPAGDTAPFSRFIFFVSPTT